MKAKLLLGLVGALALVGLAALLVASGVLAAIVPVRGETATEEPLQGRALWESKGIENYRYVLERNCFCILRGPVVVEVRDGEMVSVVDEATGEPTVDGFALIEEFRNGATIDRLFDLIAEAEAEGAARIDVTYDETYGFPSELYIDQSETMADEEMGYVVSRFEVIE